MFVVLVVLLLKMDPLHASSHLLRIKYDIRISVIHARDVKRDFSTLSVYYSIGSEITD